MADSPPVTRVTLGEHTLATTLPTDRVEVRRISMSPGVMPGEHWHNGPVFGVIESGSVHFQVSGGEERVLRAGDTFFEPGDHTISRFDATADGVTFLGWFLLRAGETPELTMGQKVDRTG